MDSVLNEVLLLALVVWIGSIVFFSFVVAPTLFRVLSPADAGKVVGAIFPNYYLLGIISGLTAIGSFVRLTLRQAQWALSPLVVIVLLAVMVVINLYARQSLTPRIDAVRDGGEAEKERFSRLHRQSVALNGLVLLMGLVVIFSLTWR